ncbi:MAG: matrixin family metalloprotease [Planctomycetes bacterium]|nr:matrixin family metalloprotease [Planctomycetota bacterium]
MLLVVILTRLASGLSAPPAAPESRPSGPAVDRDPPIHFTIRGRWPDPRQLRVFIDVEGCPIDPDDYRAAIRRALDTWSATGVVGFTDADARSDADVTVGWKDAGTPETVVFRHGSVAIAGPVRPGTFIDLHRGQTWSTDGETRGFGLYQTALHEVGHVLGLDHSANLRSPLFSRYEQANRQLSESELAALHSLYGGGRDRTGDVEIVRFGPDGKPTRVTPALRRIAPPAERSLAVLDLSGDGRDEIITWPRGGDLERGLQLYSFDEGGRLVRTYGPFPLLVDSSLHVAFTTTAEGDAALIHFDDTGRYTAVRFHRDRIVPVQPIIASGTRLVFGNGMVDDDGDGRLERTEPERTASPLPGWRVEASADLDGDGREELLLSRPRESGPQSGPRTFGWFEATAVTPDTPPLHRFEAYDVLPCRSGPDGERWWAMRRSFD